MVLGILVGVGISVLFAAILTVVFLFKVIRTGPFIK